MAVSMRLWVARYRRLCVPWVPPRLDLTRERRNSRYGELVEEFVDPDWWSPVAGGLSLERLEDLARIEVELVEEEVVGVDDLDVERLG